MAVIVLSINLSNPPGFAQVCISEGGNSSCGPAPTKVPTPKSSLATSLTPLPPPTIQLTPMVSILLKIIIVYLCDFWLLYALSAVWISMILSLRLPISCLHEEAHKAIPHSDQTAKSHGQQHPCHRCYRWKWWVIFFVAEGWSTFLSLSAMSNQFDISTVCARALWQKYWWVFFYEIQINRNTPIGLGREWKTHTL